MAYFVLSISAVSPIPDTAGLSFQFDMPYCKEDETYSICVVPQTTEAVNLTLMSYGGEEEIRVPGGIAVRHVIACQDESWNNTSNSGNLCVPRMFRVFVIPNFALVIFIKKKT